MENPKSEEENWLIRAAKRLVVLVPDLDLDETSDNFRFSAAIAEFGLILRNSQYKEEASMEDVIAMAKDARGEDEEGYRAEFLKLVKLADSLKEWSAVK